MAARREDRAYMAGLVARAQNRLRAVAGEMRLAVNFNRQVGQVDNPDLGDARAAIGGKFVLAVRRQGRVRNLHQQEDVGWLRMAFAIKIRRRFGQHQIRLRFGMVVQPHGVLNGRAPATLARRRENIHQKIDDAAVKGSDGRHINDFPVEQFHARVRLEHAGFRHAVIFVHTETMFGRR